MRKFARLLSLTVLVAFEALLIVLLLGDFLPRPWRAAIESTPYVAQGGESRDWSMVTHPALDQELDGIFKQHPWLGRSMKLVELLLAVGTAVLILKVWRLPILQPEGQHSAHLSDG